MKIEAGSHELAIGKPPKSILIATVSISFLTLISILHHLIINNSTSPIPPPFNSTVTRLAINNTNTDNAAASGPVNEYARVSNVNKGCDIFSGEWVPDPRGPYYTNDTCWAIHDHQNCLLHGRPDAGFMKWRWRPFRCELPVLNPARFLRLVRGKSLAFVGDSVARNQMQSLICLLSRVEYPVDVSYTKDERFKRWKYVTYNFTLAIFTSPYLVKTEQADSDGPTGTGLFNLYLDEEDEQWTTQIDEFNYLIISAGHWFFRPLIFYKKRKRVGCHFCRLENVPDLTEFYGYRKAFRSAFKAINNRKNYKGITYLRTFAPSHFEGGLWNEGGDCVRTIPFKSNETFLGGDDMEMYFIQIEEFRKAEAEGRKRGLEYRLLDTTQATLLRPDGHPSKYGHWPNEKVEMHNDCVHWCLPGPVDAWNDLLLQMMKMDRRWSREETTRSNDKSMFWFW